MNIGIDTRIAYYSKSGIGAYAIELIRNLAVEADECHQLMVMPIWKDKGRITYPPGVRTKMLVTPAHNRWESLLLPVELWNVRLSVFHHLDMVSPLVNKYRTVLTIHDLYFLKKMDYLASDARRHYEKVRHYAPLASHIIAISNHTRKDIIDLLNIQEERISVVYLAGRPLDCSMNGDHIPVRTMEKYGIRKRVILHIGAIEPRKNLKRLVQAFGCVNRSLGGLYCLVLIGKKDPVYYDEVRSEAQQTGIVGDVIFLDYIPDEDLNQFYRQAAVFVYPSLYEGFGMPPLEAMACGAPVVASNASCLPEILGDAALLVDPLDVHAIADSIYNILTNNELRHKLMSKGIARAKQFTWKNTARQTLVIYDNITKQP